MANQYFENNPSLSHDLKEISFYMYPNTYSFFTDNGVFSKNEIDYGTRVLLNNVVVDNAQSLLDVGCGYGIIGIALGKKYPHLLIHMVDVNDRAIALSQNNAIKNGINNYQIYNSNAYENVKDKFDLIITNPPIRAGKKVVDDICLNSVYYLNDDGNFYCVIQKKQGAPSLITRLKQVYKMVEIVTKDKGYYVIKCNNM